MNTLSRLRERLIRFYNRTDMYLVPVLKFFLAFLLFYGINSQYGYMEMINKIFVVVSLAILCALLPLAGTVAVGMVLIVLHCFGISTEIGIFAACLYLLMYILILRFVPKDCLAILLTPFAFGFHVEAAVPITLGMLGRVSSVLTGICAVVSYFFLRQLPQLALLKTTDEVSALEILKGAIDGIVKNMSLLMTAIVFAAVILVVYIIRKLCTTYGWLISILVGTAVYIVLMMCGAAFLEIPIDMPAHILGSLLSAGISLVIAFFCFNADYKGSRYVQFEDDDYYYYVKAIPKIKVSFEEDEDGDDDEVYFKNEDVKEYQDKNGRIDYRQATRRLDTDEKRK